MARVLLSAEYARLRMPRWVRASGRPRPVDGSQIQSLPWRSHRPAPAARDLPSGEKASDQIGAPSVCSSPRTPAFEATSHDRTSPRCPPELPHAVRVLPSGEKATDSTQTVKPPRVSRSVQEATSHSLTSPETWLRPPPVAR